MRLVDSAGNGIEKITPRGVVVADREYELDCIVYATSFDFMIIFAYESGLRNGDSVVIANMLRTTLFKMVFTAGTLCTTAHVARPIYVHFPLRYIPMNLADCMRSAKNTAYMG